MKNNISVSQSTRQIGDLKMRYRVMGTGRQAILCLHGFPQTGAMWLKLGAYLGEDYSLIAPDLRGAGETERPSSGYDKKTMAADVHSLLGVLGFESAFVVGHDIGGMVAYALAAQWPECVKKLVIIEVLLPGFGLEGMYAVRKPGEFAHMPFFMAPDLPEWLIGGREQAFIAWFIRNIVSDQSAFGDDDIRAYADVYARPGALRAAFDVYRAFWQDADDNRLFAKTKLAMPVLAVGGEMSVGKGLEMSLQPLALNLGGLVFQNTGHFVPDEQPEQLAAALRKFFEPI